MGDSPGERERGGQRSSDPSLPQCPGEELVSRFYLAGGGLASQSGPGLSIRVMESYRPRSPDRETSISTAIISEVTFQRLRAFLARRHFDCLQAR